MDIHREFRSNLFEVATNLKTLQKELSDIHFNAVAIAMRKLVETVEAAQSITQGKFDGINLTDSAPLELGDKLKDCDAYIVVRFSPEVQLGPVVLNNMFVAAGVPEDCSSPSDLVPKNDEKGSLGRSMPIHEWLNRNVIFLKGLPWQPPERSGIDRLDNGTALKRREVVRMLCDGLGASHSRIKEDSKRGNSGKLSDIGRVLFSKRYMALGAVPLPIGLLISLAWPIVQSAHEQLVGFPQVEPIFKQPPPWMFSLTPSRVHGVSGTALHL